MKHTVLIGLALALPACGSDPVVNDDNDDNPNVPTEPVALCSAVSPEMADFQSNLPIVVVDTFGNEDINNDERPRVAQSVNMTIFDVDATSGVARLTDVPIYHGPAGMHIRGNSTVDYDKKQYSVETWDQNGQDIDIEPLGFPAEEDWILHAPYSDKSLMRNHLMYQWSNAIGRYAARTRFVETFLCTDDGGVSAQSYQGVYVFMEKVKRDANRINLDKLGPEHTAEPDITGGYVLKRDWIGEPGDEWFTTETYEDDILQIYPKPDQITEAQRGWIRDYVNRFEVALSGPNFADPDQGYAAFIDVDSFIDHHLLVELGRNVDGFVLSTFMQKPRGGKLAMGPIWDYNGALGNADYFGAWDPEGWHHENPEFPEDNPNGYRWYERLFQDPAFVQRYQQRWQTLRAGPLATEQLMRDIDDTAASLSEAAARNFDRWMILGEYVWPNDEGFENRLSYQAEVDYLKSWLSQRLTWMDETLAP